jgi:hypothetical protein
MEPSRAERISIQVASTLLSLHLIPKRLSSSISWGVVMYSLHFPLRAQISQKFGLIVFGQIIWCAIPLWEGFNHRNFQTVIDRSVISSTNLTLLFGFHRDDSFLPNYRLIQWISRISSSRESWVICVLFVAVCYSSNAASAFVLYRWFSFVGIFGYLHVRTSLFLRKMFFDAQGWIYRNRRFFQDLTTKCIVNFFEYLVYFLLIRGVMKLIWGYNLFSWFGSSYYLIPVYCWILVRNTSQIEQRHRYSSCTSGTKAEATYPSYEYHPLLTPRHIRLLLLHPRHPSGPVKCSLIPISLDDAPNFEAISYTVCYTIASLLTGKNKLMGCIKWGSLTEKFSVLVDGQEIRVTANAYNLLRDRSSYLLPRLIWIDSICIKQEAEGEMNIEKTQQVKLMGDIYKRAALVTVWLSSSAAIQSNIEEYEDNLQAALAVLHIKRLQAMILSSASILSRYKTLGSEGQKPLWASALKLINQSYFERSWVVQELVLASSVRVMYRRVEIDWQTMIDGLLELARGDMLSNLVLQTEDDDTRSVSATNKLNNLLQIQSWRKMQQRGESISFSAIASAIRRFKATDPRDKIFAVQGFCEKAIEDWTVPEYSKELSEVYLDAAHRVIREEGILRILFDAGIGYFKDTTPGLKSLPSWAPDWSRAPKSVNLSYFKSDIDYKAGRVAHLETYPENHRFHEKSLFLSTYFFDTVAELANSHEIQLSDTGVWNISQGKKVCRTFIDSYRLIEDSIRRKNPYEDSTSPQPFDIAALDLAWRLFIGDRTLTDRPAPLSVYNMYEAYLQTLLMFLGVLGMNATERNRPVTEEQMTLSFKGYSYKALIMRAWAGRRVCITKKGYLGLVPDYSEKGDIIAVVVGAQTPFVLRPADQAAEGNKYRLVGECYIHGIMDGEALADISRTNILEVEVV